MHPRDMRKHPGIKRPYLSLPASLEGTQSFCVTIPDGLDNKLALIDLLGTATLWFNWERSLGTEGKQTADAWRDTLNLPELKMCCCPEPTNRRFNSDGQLEVSYDGGLTWVPAPELDDRVSGAISPPIPGADGSDKACAAAASAEEYVKLNFIEELTEGDSYAQIYAAAVAIIAALGVTGIGILIAAAAAAIFVAGVAIVQAAFTTEVWTDFRCILYCHIEEDGSFTASGWEMVKADILSTYTGVVSAVLYNWVNSVGVVGLTNAARSQFVAEADCDSCECDDTWCYNFDFSASDGDWSQVTSGGYLNGSWPGAPGWVATDHVNTVQNPDTADRLIFIQIPLPARTVTKFTVTYDYTGGTYDTNTLRALFITLNGVDRGNIIRSAMVNGSSQTFEIEGSWGGITDMAVFLRSSRDISSPYTYSGAALIRSIQVEGTGDNPFGADNCS